MGSRLPIKPLKNTLKIPITFEGTNSSPVIWKRISVCEPSIPPLRRAAHLLTPLPFMVAPEARQQLVVRCRYAPIWLPNAPLPPKSGKSLWTRGTIVLMQFCVMWKRARNVWASNNLMFSIFTIPWIFRWNRSWDRMVRWGRYANSRKRGLLDLSVPRLTIP